MRTEQEMLERILHFAQEREDIKAVYMNGSRANPKAPKDILQDFDIVYVVESTAPYIQDKSWIPFFGEIAVMQEPDDKDFWDNNSSPEKQYAYLLQFKDGNRIDLTFQSLQTARETYGKDSLTKILLDKDQLLPSLPPPDDSSYRIKKPTEKEFARCCNEFWWVSCYAAKGIWRKEPTYALETMNLYIRPQLYRMLCWYGGIFTDFQQTPGKCGKYVSNLLPKSDWEMYLSTYPTAEMESLKYALKQMILLFQKTAHFVADHFQFFYNQKEEAGSIFHTENVLNDTIL